MDLTSSTHNHQLLKASIETNFPTAETYKVAHCVASALHSISFMKLLRKINKNNQNLVSSKTSSKELFRNRFWIYRIYEEC